MFWLPEEVARSMRDGELIPEGEPPSGTTWEDWQRVMLAYESAGNSSGSPRISFWIIIKLDKGNFSNEVVWHDSIPMLVPASGTGELMGIALDKKALDKMVSEDEKHVHLVYKVRLQGEKAWRDLLEFLARNNMLDPAA